MDSVSSQLKSARVSNGLSQNEVATIIDEALGDSGATISTSAGSTTSSNNTYSVPINTDNPVITVTNKLGDSMGNITLTNDQLSTGKANITIKEDLNSKLDNMDTQSMNSESSSSNDPANNGLLGAYYPYEHNGHKYNAGVHVQCNDFNGPANTSHYYWSREYHKVKALRNFIESDCDWHQIEYGCEMNGNKKCHGLNKNPGNCSSFSSSLHHTNWSIKLWWRN